MVSLRATKKLMARLPSPTVSAPGSSVRPALGDWYANRIVIDRKPLLVLVSAESLLPIVAGARDVRGLPSRLPTMIGERLVRLGVEPELVGAEVSSVPPVHVAPTADRSVLGILTDFCLMLRQYLPRREWSSEDLFEAERNLGATPCFASSRVRDTVFPDRDTVGVLWRRWSATP